MKIKLDLNYHQNAYDSYLFTSFIVDPSNPADTPSSVPLTVGLYVEDFVYVSKDPLVKENLQCLLKDTK
jgi:hypothetical protein